jgi:hypothetical protein
MPEVKASPATPDKSLSHSRYSLAIDILKFSVLRRNPPGPWYRRQLWREFATARAARKDGDSAYGK